MTISKLPTCVGLRALPGLRVGNVGGGVAGRHRMDLQHLQPTIAALRLGDDARAFAQRREAVAAQHRHMDQNVAAAVVGHDEPVTLADIEPFDAAGDFDERLGGARVRDRAECADIGLLMIVAQL